MVLVVIGFNQTVVAQKIFKNTSSSLYTVDLSTCTPEEEYYFYDFNLKYNEGIDDIYFHPDGRLYMAGGLHIYIYNVTDRRVEEVIPLSDMSINKRGFNLLTINEEGLIVISDHQNDPNTFKELDLRNRVAKSHESEKLLANNKFFSGINGIMPDGRFLMFSGKSFGNTYRLWDSSSDSIFNIQVDHSDDYSLQDAAIYFPACEPLQLISLGWQGTDFISNLNINTGTNTLQKACPDIKGFIGRGQTAHPTGFRQSPLRIDLDADNSSHHIAAGYYDTLTSCRKEVPVMDDDMELYTCEAEVDYISFRLRYYDDPRLPDERIYAEGFPNPEKTSPGRYVWKNTPGAKEDKIKEYLRSLRYYADWTDPDEKERVVMTTMHVGEDSTTSWSVYQLERGEVYAGRDTLREYCPKPTPGPGYIDLTYALSEGVDKMSGRFEPELSGGRGLFKPYVDEDGDYLYIIELDDCADTAVIRVEWLETYLENIELDTVKVCPGEKVKIGFPPGKLHSIEWWDGSSEDSIWIGADDINPYVEVSQGNCTGRVDITVLVRLIGKVPGRDTTIRYCTGGALIDLKEVSELSDNFSYEINPPVSGSDGSLVFDPTVDAAGTYHLVARVKGCTDTTTIVMEETMTQELVLEPVRLCAGMTQRIGLEPGVYDQVTWWNGDSGDSTTVSDGDSGPLTVEARQDGCVYQGEVDLTIVPEVVLSDDYPDHIMVCEGDSPEAEMITVTGLDSVLWENSIYYPGETITITRGGESTLRGYQGGCLQRKP